MDGSGLAQYVFLALVATAAHAAHAARIMKWAWQ